MLSLVKVPGVTDCHLISEAGEARLQWQLLVMQKRSTPVSSISLLQLHLCHKVILVPKNKATSPENEKIRKRKVSDLSSARKCSCPRTGNLHHLLSTTPILLKPAFVEHFLDYSPLTLVISLDPHNSPQ
jgi:hypothetical protein